MAGGLLIALGKGKPMAKGDDEEEASEDSSASDEAYSEACGDAFDALKSGDRAGFAKALKKALSYC